MRFFTRTLLVAMALWMPGFVGAFAAENQETQYKDQARALLQTLSASDNPYIAGMAAEQLEKWPEHSGTMEISRIPLLRNPHHSLVIPVQIDTVHGAFMIDTGATYSVITPETARQLGVNSSSEPVSIRTANGSIRVPRLTLPLVQVNGLEVKNLEVIVHPLSHDPSLAGLLGLNFFRGREFSVRNNHLLLKSGSF